MKRLSIICILVVLFATQAACSLATTLAAASASATPSVPAASLETSPEPTFTAVPAVKTPSSGQISLDLLKNFTYSLDDFKTQVTLQDGVFNDSQNQGQLIEPVAFGDLNGDGQTDAALIVAINTGGSGTFFNLIAVLNKGGAPVQAGYSYIGDRQVIKNLEIVDGQIILDYLTQGPNDPLCCSSQHRLRSYRLENGVLRLTSEQIEDSPTVQTTP